MVCKQRQAFRMCILPCPRYLNGWGYTHSSCCLFGRGACTVSAREHSGSRSPGLWSRCWRGTARAAVLGFAKGSVSGGRDGHCLFSAFTWQVQWLVSGLGSTCCGFFRPIEAQTLQLSDSEELDVISANANDTEDLPPQSRAYEKLRLWQERLRDWALIASREGGHSFKKQTWRTLLTFSRTTSMLGIAGFCPDLQRDHGRKRFILESIVHKHNTLFLYIK